MANQTDPPHRRPWSGLSSTSASSDIAILGVPFDGAASFRKGASEAPSKIRSLTPHIAPFTECGRSLAGLRVNDLGDIALTNDWAELSTAMKTRLPSALAHPFTIVLGGDHSITIPVACAVSDADVGTVGYLHLDAHLDLMSRFEGREHSHACTARRVLELPAFTPQHAVFLGIRSWLGDECDFLADHPEITVVPAADLHGSSVVSIAEAAIASLRAVDAVYVTVDIDVLDPAFAPGTGTPEAGGLSTRSLLQMLKLAFAELPIRVLDIVEVSPSLDSSDITSVAAAKLIYECFGWIKERG